MNWPKVSILMAIYRPQEEWLNEQLHSLVLQDYSGEIELYIWNDSPNEFDISMYLHQIEFPIAYQVFDNGRNNGITTAFEELSRVASGKYIAYCDQDDIWASNKISQMVEYMEEHKSCLCTHCDAELIDSNRHILQESLFLDQKNIINSSEYQSTVFLRKNWTLGCAMLLRADAVKAAMPFPRMVYNDQWLAIWSVFHGEFVFLSKKLLMHRIHANHNSQMLAGISNSKEYYEKKLVKDNSFLRYIIEHIPLARKAYALDVQWCHARMSYHYNKGIKNFWRLWKLRKIRYNITCFELILPIIPDGLLLYLLRWLRRNT